MKIIEIKFSGNMFHDFWAVVEKDGELLTARCDASMQARAEFEAKRDIKSPYKLVALARVGHTAYNQVGPGFKNQVASAVLEAAAPILGVKYAEAPADAPQHPNKWISEEWEEEDNRIAREEAALELACESGLIAGAMPADI